MTFSKMISLLPKNASNFVISSFLKEYDRWFLWLPVAFGIGISLYFCLNNEPSLWIGFSSAFLIGCLIYILKRHKSLLYYFSIFFLFVLLGFLMSQIRALVVDAPVIDSYMKNVTVDGVIDHIQAKEDHLKITLKNISLKTLKPDETPKYIRLNIKNGHIYAFEHGDRLFLKADLFPPSPPVYPGAYDFQRVAFFKQIGAVGRIKKIQQIEKGQGKSIHGYIQEKRQNIKNNIINNLDNKSQGLAAALIIGDRSLLDADLIIKMRNSGLSHILAISGLHISLVSGFVFVLMRALLAFYPHFVLNYSIKKWAAIFSLVTALVYTLLAGATLPTQRAFIMVSLVIIALMLDRDALSMRSVAIAALAILIVKPESLLNISFQLSFAAVVALIAFYEAIKNFMESVERGALQRILLYFAGVIFTSIVAIIATTPFSIYHFEKVALYGLAANFIAIPLTAFWIMPCVVFYLLLYPLGLGELALSILGPGLEILSVIANNVSSWGYSIFLIQPPSVYSMAFIILGGIWICLWQTKWRFFGIIPVLIAFMYPLWQSQQNIYLFKDGQSLIYQDKRDLYYWSLSKKYKTSEKKLRKVFSERFDIHDGQKYCDDELCQLGENIYLLGKEYVLPKRSCIQNSMIISREALGSCSNIMKAKIFDQNNIVLKAGMIIDLSKRIRNIKGPISKNRYWTNKKSR